MSNLAIAMVMAVVMATGLGGEQAAEEGTLAFAVADAEPILFNGLKWRIGPDRDMRWDEARDWVESQGNGWRMPSIEELEGLFEAGVSAEAWGPFQCGGEWVWSDFPGAWDFLYGDGVGYPTGMEPSVGHRVFAVRSVQRGEQ